MDTMTALEELPLFAGLSLQELGQISEEIDRVTVPAGTRLVYGQLPPDAVFFLVEGSARLQVVTEEGTEYTVAILGPGDMMGDLGGHGSLSTAAGTLPVEVVTRELTTLLWIERRPFDRLLGQFPSLSRNLTGELARMLRRAEDHIKAFAVLDATGRAASQLLDFAERYGHPVPGEGVRIGIPLTQGEIADMIGAVRDRGRQILVSLERAGVFTSDPQHRLTIQRPEILAELARR